jgi:formyl-CoA transferase
MSGETTLRPGDERSSAGRRPLEGLRVIDCATVLAGPLIATVLGDFGADVIKIEHPSGDSLRQIGHSKDEVPMWWKVTSRNKRCITLDLKTGAGQDILRRLAADADVLVENFRVGTLEGWGIGWEALSAINPRLVMVRVTGFGQTGPYRRRPGFGTLAEAFSGFAHLNGQPDGPPTLPPFGLADGVAAQYGTFATMFALWERDMQGSGLGQFIDLSIYEPLFALLGYQPTLYDQTGMAQGRTGNRSINNAPRNAYRTKEGRWVALSSSTPSIVERVLRLTGGDAAAEDPRFQTAADRLAHVDEVDRIVGGWIERHTLEEVLRGFEAVEAAIAPVYSVAEIFQDPQYKARLDIVEVADDELGSLRMQNVFPYLSRTPGRVEHAGPRLGQHNREVLGQELGFSEAELAELKARGVI